MLNNKDYCDYDTCVALEELGFPIKRIKVKGEEKNVPILLYEAQKWLSKEKKIEVNATYDNVVELHWHWYMKSLINRNQTTSIINHDSYESALLAGIKEAIKILKEVKKSDNTSVKFTSILRLIEIIPSNVWNQDNRGRVYAEKLANILESEGYSKDAQLVREKIKQMNGENVPLAIMD